MSTYGCQIIPPCRLMFAYDSVRELNRNYYALILYVTIGTVLWQLRVSSKNNFTHETRHLKTDYGPSILIFIGAAIGIVSLISGWILILTCYYYNRTYSINSINPNSTIQNENGNNSEIVPVQNNRQSSSNDLLCSDDSDIENNKLFPDFNSSESLLPKLREIPTILIIQLRLVRFFSITLLIALGIVLIGRSANGVKDEDYNYSKDVLVYNNEAIIKQIPADATVALILMLSFNQVVVRADRLTILISWIICVISISVSVAVANASESFIMIVFAFISIVFLLEFDRNNFEKYQSNIEAKRLMEEKFRSEVKEQSLKQQSEQLRHLIANVAHDLKTPLQSFSMGCSELKAVIEEAVDISKSNSSVEINTIHLKMKTAEELTNVITPSIDFMNLMINRAIDFTKVSHGILLKPHFSTINLKEFVEYPLSIMRSLQKRITLSIDESSFNFSSSSSSSSPSSSSSSSSSSSLIADFIITDGQWLRENILCLLSNAVKYSHSGEVVCRVKLVSVQGLETTTKPDQKSVNDSNSSILQENGNRKRNNSKENFHLRFEILDTGIGIPNEERSKLFKPFVQAQRKTTGGTGLGLFALANRVEALGGKYGIDDREDGKQGSLFYFTMPYKPDNSMSPKMLELIDNEINSASVASKLSSPQSVEFTSSEGNILMPELSNISNSNNSYNSSSNRNGSNSSSNSSDSSNSSSGVSSKSSRTEMRRMSNSQIKPLKLLVVDDSPIILKMADRALRIAGHTVLLAENGVEAIALLTEHGKFDCIISDLQMPVMDGIESTKRIRKMEKMQVENAGMIEKEDKTSNKSTNHQLIFGMSANSDDETEREALEAGMDHFLPKPFNVASFHLLMSKYT